MDYKFGAKGNWRRTIWNRIVERIPPWLKIRNAVVVYLAGHQDFDRSIALSKGFMPHNLIAIERDKNVAAILRNKGILVIEGGFADVLRSWRKLRVDVVFADLCCGATPEVVQLSVQFAFATAFADAVIAVNLMRGRETFPDRRQKFLAGQHRGRVLMYATAGAIFDIAKRYYPDTESARRFVWNDIAANFCGWTGSYKSTTGQVFDSAVWRNTGLIKWAPSIEKLREDWAAYTDSADFKHEFKNLRSRIAAVKAVRTIRMAR